MASSSTPVDPIVLPMLHPAFLLRGKAGKSPTASSATGRVWDGVFLDDLRRAFEFAEGRVEIQRWKYKIAPTFDEAVAFLRAALREDEVALDTETTTGDPLHSRILCYSVATRRRGALCIPLLRNRAREEYWPAAQRAEIARLTRRLIESRRVGKILQNLRYDDAVFRAHGFGALAGPLWDTMYLHKVPYPELPMGLAFLLSRYTLAENHKYMVREGAADTKGAAKFVRIKDEILWEYNCYDSACLFPIKDALLREVRRVGLLDVYRTDMRLSDLGRRMQERGIAVNFKRRAVLRADMSRVIKNSLATMRRISGVTDLRPGRSAQLGQALFRQLGAPIVARTPKGAASTDQATLALILARGGCPASARRFIRALQHWRKAAKLRSTYIDGVQIFAGRVHPTWRAAVLKTGRWAARAPNMQNIPAKSKRRDDPLRESNFRRMFRARRGYILVWGDAAQIELKVIATLARAKGLLAILNDPTRDVHSEFTSRLFGVPLEQVTKNTAQRDLWKRYVYQWAYGGRWESIYELLRVDIPDLDPRECRILHARLGVEIPEVPLWWAEIEEEYNRAVAAHPDRWVRVQESVTGHVRNFAGEFADNRSELYNWRVQSTATAVVNATNLLVDAAIHREHLDAHQILQGHDELGFEVRRDGQMPQRVARLVQDAAVRVSAKHRFPTVFNFDFAVGRHWSDGEKLEVPIANHHYARARRIAERLPDVARPRRLVAPTLAARQEAEA